MTVPINLARCGGREHSDTIARVQVLKPQCLTLREMRFAMQQLQMIYGPVISAH